MTVTAAKERRTRNEKALARFRRSTFARFALSYICLLVLVLLGIFGYMYTYVEREVRDRVLDSHINRLSRIAYQHEDYMNTMLNTALQMGLSPFIEPFDYATEPARAYQPPAADHGPVGDQPVFAIRFS